MRQNAAFCGNGLKLNDSNQRNEANFFFNKMFDRSKLKAFADQKKASEKLRFVLQRVGKKY